MAINLTYGEAISILSFQFSDVCDRFLSAEPGSASLGGRKETRTLE